MAFIICPEHGGIGAAAVCSHVAEWLRAPQPIAVKLVPVRTSHAGTTLGPTWLCPECAARCHVPYGGATCKGDGGLEQYWSGIDWSPVRPRCLERGRAPAD